VSLLVAPSFALDPSRGRACIFENANEGDSSLIFDFSEFSSISPLRMEAFGSDDSPFF